MIRIASEQEFLENFRPSERDEVQLPDGIQFPLILRDYMAWTEPSGHRVYLVVNDPHKKDVAFGVVFKRGHGSSDAPAQMCEWCHSVRGGNSVALLTAAASSKRRVGLYLCRNLDCKEKALSTPGVNDMRVTPKGHDKVPRIVERMVDFIRRELF